MMTHEADTGRSPAARPGLHRLIPMAGITAVIVVGVAHLGGGAVLMHAGLSGALGSLGLGGGALVVGLAAIVGVKLLVALGARRWSWQR